MLKDKSPMKIPLDIAADIGCTKSMLKKINRGTQPSLKLALAIVRELDGDAPRLTEMIPLLKDAFQVMLRQGTG